MMKIPISLTILILCSFYLCPSVQAQTDSRYKGYRGNIFNKEKNQKFDIWMQNIYQRFNSAVERKKLFFSEQIVTCKFRIDNKGRIVSPKIVRSSSSKKINELAIKTINETKPLSKELISLIKGQTLTINFGEITDLSKQKS